MKKQFNWRQQETTGEAISSRAYWTKPKALLWVSGTLYCQLPRDSPFSTSNSREKTVHVHCFGVASSHRTLGSGTYKPLCPYRFLIWSKIYGYMHREGLTTDKPTQTRQELRNQRPQQH